MTSSKGELPPPCPDPSVHPQYVAGMDSANKAAQLATHSPSSSRDIEALGPDGRLSAAGAAASLRHAKPQDLPSFPTVGIDAASSGNKAASIASSSQKPIEIWKPDPSSSASKAALLASKDGGKLDWWQYNPDGTGNQAASAAMGKHVNLELDYGFTKEGHRRALLAASKSLSGQDKSISPPSSSSGPSYPDQQNAGFNALNAAAVANRPTSADYRMSDPGMEAARVKNLQGVSRDMYGDRPQVALEVEEKRRQEALHASAVSMAKQLYDLEKDDINRMSTTPGAIAAERVGSQTFQSATASTSGDALRMQAMNYIKVQEAAQKLASERLAKLDPDGVLAYREHYGYGPQGSKSKLAMLRGKGTSTEQAGGVADDGGDSSDDEVQAAKIKSQMSNLNNQVASVDASKRAQDRESLMVAAERAVQARMSTMDEKVFAETGKMSPHMAAEWEAKAKAKAAAESEQRMANHGKVHIGGGKYMDQAEIEAIAATRMQPTLDEINDEAERRRAHEAAVKADLEHHKEQAEIEKQREKDVKAELKRVADEEKEKARQEKAAEKERLKQERDAEKEKQNLEKMHRDLERRMAKAEAKQAKEQEKLEREQREKIAQEQRAEARQRQIEAETKKKEEEAEENKDAPAIVNAPDDVDVLEPEDEGPSTETAPEVAPEVARAATPEATPEIVSEAVPEAPAEATPEPVREPTPEATPEATPTARAIAATTETQEDKDTSTPSKRDSRLKGFLGKLTGRRSSKVEDDSSVPVAATTPAVAAVAPAPAEKEEEKEEEVRSPSPDPAKEVAETQDLSEKAKGKQPASINSVSSLSETSDTPPKLGSVDTGTDVFEEARDRFDSDAGAAARTSIGKDSTGSKFQEQL